MINIQNLSFYYNDYDLIFDNLSLNIKKGTYTSILGSNGCGKSTLTKLILKFLKPSSGSISINTNSIGYVPQKMDTFNSKFPITVYELLNCHRKVLHIKNINSIDNSLKIVHMQNFKNALIGTLSGGQLQKVFIAKALMGNPSLLILDEPSTGIDAKSQNEIYTLVKKLNESNNMTIISIEHNLNAALNYSDFIFEINNKKGTLFDISEYRKRFF